MKIGEALGGLCSILWLSSRAWRALLESRSFSHRPSSCACLRASQVRRLARRCEKGHGRGRPWMALACARVHFSALQSQRGPVLSAGHATHDYRSDRHADDCARIGLRDGVTKPMARPTAWVVTLVFAAIFWIWHSPVFYDETLRSNARLLADACDNGCRSARVCGLPFSIPARRLRFLSYS